MNWDNARYFLTLARIGTLRGTAAALGVDQATVGRRLAAFEAELGTKLFLRTAQRYELTPAAISVLADAEAMEAAADALARKSSGADEMLTGTVRVASTDTMAEGFVLRALAAVHRNHPEIDLVLTTSTQLSNLSRREADLAVRTIRPDAADLVIRRLGSIEMGLYASRAYVAARGLPVPGSAFAGHDLILFPRAVIPARWHMTCGEPTANARIVLQATSTVVMGAAVREGLGIAALPFYAAEGDPNLVRVLPERRDDPDIWLVVHPDLARAARVRVVMQAIADSFAELNTKRLKA